MPLAARQGTDEEDSESAIFALRTRCPTPEEASCTESAEFDIPFHGKEQRRAALSEEQQQL